jgi:hypothetical protein
LPIGSTKLDQDVRRRRRGAVSLADLKKHDRLRATA